MKTNAKRELLIESEEYIKNICWGLLFHTLGLYQESIAELKKIKNKKKDNSLIETLEKIADSIISHDECLKKNRKKILSKREVIVKQIGGLLNFNTSGDIPKLSKECLRMKQTKNSRNSHDGFENGYSRDPFKKIKPGDKSAIALAAISYIVRAHSLFFCRRSDERDFNCAKVALNDLFQASQLASRLYYSLTYSHFNLAKNIFSYNTDSDNIDISQQKYFEKIKIGPKTNNEQPWNSAFFIWNLHQLVEIQRGNIYRFINYLNESDRHYRHAEVRFDRLTNSKLNVHTEYIINKKTDHFFITLTLVRTLFERSKVLFDLGLHIESLMNQLRCLAYLIRIDSKVTENPDILKLLKNISTTLDFLDVIRKQSVFDKESITKFFGFYEQGNSELNSNSFEALKPIRFKRLLSGKKVGYEIKTLAVEILARIGFLLIIFQRGNILHGKWDKKRNTSANKYRDFVHNSLKPFFTIGDDLEIVPGSSLAKYCLTIINYYSKNSNDSSPVFPESIEREFAHKLRKKNIFKTFDGKPLKEHEFYGRILDLATQNIDNIITIPRRLYGFLIRPGYFSRRATGDLSAKTVYESLTISQKHKKKYTSSEIEKRKKMIGNKLVILRRWQSFTPKIPSRSLPYNSRGGGYFLLWQGKGIVIDPGYDFIQNFYDEGFSLDDIDAVIISHSHPDHDDDLSTLTTLIREWNEYFEYRGHNEESKKKIDLFLNESTYLKFSAWLKASQFGLGRIIPLPTVIWDDKSKKQTEEIRGKNVLMHLRYKFCFDLEIIPAWHDDVIGKTAAIGLKFHLFTKANIEKSVGIVGYTGDTGVYIQNEKATNEADLTHFNNIEHQYKDCDVLIANLGDIRLRELSTFIKKRKRSDTEETELHFCIKQMFEDLFCDVTGNGKHVNFNKVTPDKVESFLSLLNTLNIIPGWAFKVALSGSSTVINELKKYFCGEKIELSREDIINTIDEVLKGLKSQFSSKVKKSYFSYRSLIDVNIDTSSKPYVEENKKVCILIGFLCASIIPEWHYEYHLGISGLFRLHKEMVNYNKKNNHKRIFVVSELPEELSSYRHHIARLLNVTENNLPKNGESKICSFTGDIGLHIKLFDNKGNKFSPKIRCTYCNYNNEMVLDNQNYHCPDKIIETPIKRLDSAMIYLCTEYDHYPENEKRPLDFLSRPVLRVI
jgi:ribonuclease BN (tRNA processing enzyme)